MYLWAFVPQLQEWQFIIATPLVDTKGPIAAYGEVQRALEKHGVYKDIPLRRIFLKSPKDRVLTLLEKQSRAAPHEDFREVNAPIAGDFVEDAYLYVGSIHIVQVQRAKPDTAEVYSVIYTPYKGPGGAAPSVRIVGAASLRDFLEIKLHIARDIVDSALRNLDEYGTAFVPEVHLTVHELKRLGLG